MHLNHKPMRIVLLTINPLIASRLIQELKELGHDVLLIVTTLGPIIKPNTAYKELVNYVRQGTDVLVTNDMQRVHSTIEGLSSDVIISANFSWKLPQNLLSIPRFGGINFHTSLLPSYRGPNPLYWCLVNDEKVTGLTLHRMDATFDTGSILVQQTINIDPDDNVDSIFSKILPLFGPMIKEALPMLMANLPGINQVVEEGSYAPSCTDEDRYLDWSQSTEFLHNKIRGWGFEGAYAQLEGQPILVRRSRIINSLASGSANKPGEVFRRTKEGIYVKTKNGLLLIEDCLNLNEINNENQAS